MEKISAPVEEKKKEADNQLNRKERKKIERSKEMELRKKQDLHKKGDIATGDDTVKADDKNDTEEGASEHN